LLEAVFAHMAYLFWILFTDPHTWSPRYWTQCWTFVDLGTFGTWGLVQDNFGRNLWRRLAGSLRRWRLRNVHLCVNVSLTLVVTSRWPGARWSWKTLVMRIQCNWRWDRPRQCTSTCRWTHTEHMMRTWLNHKNKVVRPSSNYVAHL